MSIALKDGQKRGNTLRVYLYALKDGQKRGNTLRVYLYALKNGQKRGNTLRVYLYALKSGQERGNMIFDTHAHYDDEAFDEDREELLASLFTHGIEAVTNVAAGMKSAKTTLALAEKYPCIYGAIGVHPNETADLEEADMKWLIEQSSNKKVVAIGEIGLDYYWDEPEREVQKRWFIRQLDLARQVKLPVIIHSRDAAKDTLDIMKAEADRALSGVIHCFSYGKEMAREYLNMGYYLGIGGVVTFKNARKLKEVVEYMPMEQLVLETDCPYLAPVPNRGKRNSSLNLPYVVQEISAIKGISEEKVIEITNHNAKRLYGLI